MLAWMGGRKRKLAQLTKNRRRQPAVAARLTGDLAGQRLRHPCTSVQLPEAESWLHTQRGETRQGWPVRQPLQHQQAQVSRGPWV